MISSPKGRILLSTRLGGSGDAPPTSNGVQDHDLCSYWQKMKLGTGLSWARSSGRRSRLTSTLSLAFILTGAVFSSTDSCHCREATRRSRKSTVKTQGRGRGPQQWRHHRRLDASTPQLQVEPLGHLVHPPVTHGSFLVSITLAGHLV